MIYKASLDKLAKITSIGVTLLFAFMAIFLFPMLQQESFWVTVLTIVFIATYAISLGYSPRAIKLQKICL
jgi:general stress protein CsbA